MCSYKEVPGYIIITLLQKRFADKEEMNLLYETTYLKTLKQKISCSELRSQAMIHHLAMISNYWEDITGPREGLHSIQAN